MLASYVRFDALDSQSSIWVSNESEPWINTRHSLSDPLFSEVCLPASDRPRYLLLPTERKRQFLLELGRYEYTVRRLLIEIFMTYQYHPYFRYIREKKTRYTRKGNRMFKLTVWGFRKVPTLITDRLYEMYDMTGILIHREIC